MRFAILSDIHIASSTPWSRDYEDINFVISQLKHMKNDRLPKFDGVILCGDIFNSPRLAQGDPSKFLEILDVLEVTDKPILAINGNHDPSGHHVCECLKGFHRLDIEPYLGIAGHSYSQDLDEIRAWLKNTKEQVVVTHQSCSAFMNLGNLDIPQLRPEDFQAPLNFIGDTHISSAIESEDKYLVSPGILCPMRSRAELFSSDPHLTVVEMDYLGNGSWDIDNADLSFIQLPKRPAIVVDHALTEGELRNIDFRGGNKPPFIIYWPKTIETNVDFSKFAHIRVLPFSDTEKELEVEVDYSTILESSKTLDTILETASQLLADDKDKPATLEIIKNLLENDQPADVVKYFLEDKK